MKSCPTCGHVLESEITKALARLVRALKAHGLIGA